MFAAPAFAAGQVHTGGLQSAQTHDRFIVKYRNGAAADQAALTTAASASAAGKSLNVTKMRRTATGADVVRSSRKLDRVEAER